MRKCVWGIVFAIFAIASWTTGCTEKKAPATDTIASDTAREDTSQTDTLDNLIAETPMPKAADELFDDFIFNFAANKRLQLKRIQFPLPVNKYGKLSYTEKKDWRMEHFFMTQDYYTLIFNSRQQMAWGKATDIDTVTVEKIYFNRNTVKQYFFYRTGGLWMLSGIRFQSIGSNQNASFLNFYERFATDSAFQSRSINDPVVFTGPDPDDDFSTMTGEIEPWQWPSFAPELPHGFIYNIIYGHKYKGSNQRIFVLRGIANGFETELTFKKMNGEWKLTKLVQ